MAGSVEEREKETLIQLLKYVESIADKKGEMQGHDLQQYAKEGGMVVTKEELQGIAEGCVFGILVMFAACGLSTARRPSALFAPFAGIPRTERKRTSCWLVSAAHALRLRCETAGWRTSSSTPWRSTSSTRDPCG